MDASIDRPAEAKVFRPDALTHAAEPPRVPRPVAIPRTRVAEITSERAPEELPELPLHLLGDAGEVAVQLRSTLRRLAIGAGLARREDLVAAVRALPGLPGLATSPAGGTFIVGGDAWLGLAAIGTPPTAGALPIDWMLERIHTWLAARLGPLGVSPDVGRVEGAWCPGFSDLGVDGRKLVGLGFRATRDWVVMRGVMAVRPMSAGDLDLLVACHRLIDVEVRAPACVSLAELISRPTLTVADTIHLLAADDAPADVR